ncbi:unnamed protein product, partial [Discosporangium mesarthrocarpum]
ASLRPSRGASAALVAKRASTRSGGRGLFSSSLVAAQGHPETPSPGQPLPTPLPSKVLRGRPPGAATKRRVAAATTASTAAAATAAEEDVTISGVNKPSLEGGRDFSSGSGTREAAATS